MPCIVTGSEFIVARLKQSIHVDSRESSVLGDKTGQLKLPTKIRCPPTEFNYSSKSDNSSRNFLRCQILATERYWWWKTAQHQRLTSRPLSQLLLASPLAVSEKVHGIRYTIASPPPRWSSRPGTLLMDNPIVAMPSRVGYQRETTSHSQRVCPVFPLQWWGVAPLFFCGRVIER